MIHLNRKHLGIDILKEGGLIFMSESFEFKGGLPDSSLTYVSNLTETRAVLFETLNQYLLDLQESGIDSVERAEIVLSALEALLPEIDEMLETSVSELINPFLLVVAPFVRERAELAVIVSSNPILTKDSALMIRSAVMAVELLIKLVKDHDVKMKMIDDLRKEQEKNREMMLALAAQLGIDPTSATYSRSDLLLAANGLKIENEETKRENARLALESQKDPLSGLMEKIHFETKLEADTSIEGDAVVVFDINLFGLLNAVYKDQTIGDKAITAVGDALKSCFREMDDLGRIGGGEEFAARMKRPGSLATVLDRVDGVYRHFKENPFEVKWDDIPANPGESGNEKKERIKFMLFNYAHKRRLLNPEDLHFGEDILGINLSFCAGVSYCAPRSDFDEQQDDLHRTFEISNARDLLNIATNQMYLSKTEETESLFPKIVTGDGASEHSMARPLVLVRPDCKKESVLYEWSLDETSLFAEKARFNIMKNGE